MTPIRKLALKVSESVVRHASPGSKEWAEALSREVAFIANDWAALGWALGSTRVLLDRRLAPIGSLADVPAQAQRFVETTRGGLGMWMPIIQGPLYALKFFDARVWSERAGCAIVVFGSICAGAYWWIEARRLKDQPSDEVYLNNAACALFYKAELERRCSNVWVPFFICICYCVGVLFAQRGGVREHPVFCAFFGLLCLIVVPAFLQARRNNLQRLARLESLLTGPS